MTKLDIMLRKAMLEDIECLLAICNDDEQKASDRVAAAKALIDYGMKDSKKDNADASTLKVVFDGIPKEYLV